MRHLSHSLIIYMRDKIKYTIISYIFHLVGACKMQRYTKSGYIPRNLILPISPRRHSHTGIVKSTNPIINRVRMISNIYDVIDTGEYIPYRTKK